MVHSYTPFLPHSAADRLLGFTELLTRTILFPSQIRLLPRCPAAHRESLVDGDIVPRHAWFVAIPPFFLTQLLTNF